MLAIIETERLYLREILASDEQGMYELDSDSEVHRYLGNSPIKTLEEARAAINYVRQQYIDNGIGRMAIVEKETNQFVGWGGLKYIREKINGHQHFYEVGYRLIRRYWGRGYATESTQATVNYAFQHLKLTVLYAFADTGNSASLHVLEKCGFVIKSEFDYEGDPHYWLELHHIDIAHL